MTELQKQFGDIDIYLFDQLLKGRIAPGMKILDAGCGGGRNLVYLLREGYDVYGVDINLHTAASANFRAEPVEAMSFPDGFADVVISSAVLHFARDREHFLAMLRGTWRVLKPGGLFFCRLASSIGLDARMTRAQGLYLVDEALLLQLTEELGGTLLDPLKTTVVQNLRCMTTWVMRKNFT